MDCTTVLAPALPALRMQRVERDEAHEELQLLKRSSSFNHGLKGRLKHILGKLKQEESTITKKVKRSRVRRITDPSTPDMRVTCVTLDPLAHLCSPMSPLRLDPHSDAEADAEAVAVEAATSCRATKKLKDTELLEPVMVSDAEDVD